MVRRQQRWHRRAGLQIAFFGREFAVGRDDTLYAATPLLEAFGLIISHAATIPDDGPKRTIMINYMRRALQVCFT